MSTTDATADLQAQITAKGDQIRQLKVRMLMFGVHELGAVN
jgi:hypothetical protein